MPNGTGTVLVPSPMPVDFPKPVDVGPGRKKVYVNPPVIRVGSGPSQLRNIQFANHTGGKASLWFPDGLPLFDGTPDQYPSHENPLVIEAGATKVLKLKPNLGDGFYHYHVHCDAIGDEADGNSPPSLSCP
jgi:hypothetical protein